MGNGGGEVQVTDATMEAYARVTATVARSEVWKGLSGKAVKMYIAVSLTAWTPRGWATTQADLAELAGLPLSTARKALTELRDAGLLAVQPRYKCLTCHAFVVVGGGCCSNPVRRQASNNYRLLLPEQPNPNQLDLLDEDDTVSGSGHTPHPLEGAPPTRQRVPPPPAGGQPSRSIKEEKSRTRTPSSPRKRPELDVAVGRQAMRAAVEAMQEAAPTTWAEAKAEARAHLTSCTVGEARRHASAEYIAGVRDDLAYVTAHPGDYPDPVDPLDRLREAEPEALATWCQVYRALTGSSKRAAIKALDLALAVALTERIPAAGRNGPLVTSDGVGRSNGRASAGGAL